MEQRRHRRRREDDPGRAGAAARSSTSTRAQGTADDEADTDLLAADYLALGYVDGKTFRHVVQAGALHSEMYWAQRFPGAMQLLLGVR